MRAHRREYDVCMRRLRRSVLLALAALLSCSSEDDRTSARHAVDQLLSVDSDEDSLAAVVDLGAVCVPYLVDRMAEAPTYLPRAGVTALLEMGDRAVPALVRVLDSDDPSRRLVAVRFLLWPEDRPRDDDTIKRCIQCLRDSDEGVRTCTAFGLVMRGHRPPETVPVLLAALDHPDPAIRSTAAECLRDYHDSVEEIVSGLLSATEDPSPEVRQAALDSIAAYWSADPRVSARIRLALSSGQPTQRVIGLQALVRVPSPPSEVAQLCMAAAADEVEAVRDVAVETLVAIWRRRRLTPSEHRTALRHPIPDVRRAACEAVAFSSSVGPRDLQPLLADDLIKVRVAAATALGVLGQEDSTALAMLATLIADANEDADITFGEDQAVRTAAAWVLIERDHRSAMAMRYLARNGYALDLVAKCGPAAKPVAPEIEQLLSETQSRDIAWALYVVTGDATKSIEALRSTLRDGDWFLAMRASIHAARYGKAAAPLVPELRKLLDHEHWGTRRYAATALGYIGEAAKPAIPRLIELLDDDENGGCGKVYSVSRHAAAALAYLDVDSPKVKALLGEVLKEWNANDGNTRPGALRYAWKHGLLTPEEVAHACTLSLNPPNWDYALPIIRLLEEMGPDATVAIPVLEKQLQRRWGIRLAAQRALHHIRRR